MADVLYVVEKKCAICDSTFEVTCVRSRLSLIKQDSDFCSHYKDVNPYYYAIWVCPHCGYAARDSEFEKVTPPMIAKIREFLAVRDVKGNFAGIRTRQQAVVTYKVAILLATLAGTLASKMAGLHLRLGWLYREDGQIEEEKQMLAKACGYFEQALDREPMPIGNMSELTVMYLIADLLWRTGDVKKAKIYLNRVVSSPQAKQEKRISDLARDLWHDVREYEKNEAAGNA